MLRIFLRNTENWENFNFDNFSKINKNKDPSINKNAKERYLNCIKEWNDFFDIDYFKYRSMLKKNAILTWENNFIVVEDIDKLIDDIEDEDYVLPIDDDDIIHPNFSSLVIENCNDEICVLNQIVIDLIDFEIKEWGDNYKVDYGTLGSSHVLFKGSLLKRIKEEDRYHFLKYHPGIYNTAKKVNAKLCIMNNMPPISCYLMHFGNFSRMTAPNDLYKKKPDWNLIYKIFNKKIIYNQRNYWCKSFVEKILKIYKTMIKKNKNYFF